MLNSRPDAAELLELLNFHPPDWRRYYEDLWARFPTLAREWVQPDFVNLPTTRELTQGELELEVRRRAETLRRQDADSLIVAELRGRALALMARRGAARVRAQRALDQRLAALGLRPRFPGGTRIPKAERPALQTRYKELRTVIDELRTVAAEEGDAGDLKYRLALLIRFPFFSETELALLFSFAYPRRGATADAALAVLARRFGTQAATLTRYLRPP